jgi:hypothetical protein
LVILLLKSCSPAELLSSWDNNINLGYFKNKSKNNLD